MPTSLLPHLIRLLDDESEVVREAVRIKLEGIKKELPDQVAELDRPLTPAEERIMSDLLAPSRREDLEDSWMSWRLHTDSDKQLEAALAQMSAFLSGWKVRPRELTERLDRLAAEVSQELGPDSLDPRTLAGWLFHGRQGLPRYRGNSKDYYSPHNSNLLWVMDTGYGNPISLCTLYRFVGRRVGVSVGGCNFPGHFLARVEHDGKVWLVDCFNRGRFMLADDVARHHPAANPSVDQVIHRAAPVETILLRFLRNLDDAFDRLGQMPERQLMRRLALKLMEPA